MRIRSKARFILQIAALFGAVAGILWILGSKTAEPSAEAAPMTPPALMVGDAGVPEASAAVAAAATEKEPGAIDVAIAPDGGVPFHPGAKHFKSPFARPGPTTSTKVKIGILVNTIDGYDVKTGTFTADFFLSLTSQTPMPSLNLQFPNGTVDKKADIADRPTFKLYRLSGTFKSAADLRRYPFDSQELRILVEDDAAGIDQMEFIPDHERTQLARGFRAVGWKIAYVDARAQSQTYPERFENDDLYYSRYAFVLGVDRYATSAAFKVFVPAFVIVLISLLGMWVPADEMEVRANSGAPMLAGAVLFHFSLMQELPSTMYLTRADKLMLAVYITLLLGMISTWWMFLVNEHNVPKVFRIARVVVPVLSAVTMALGCLG